MIMEPKTIDALVDKYFCFANAVENGRVTKKDILYIIMFIIALCTPLSLVSIQVFVGSIISLLVIIGIFIVGDIGLVINERRESSLKIDVTMNITNRYIDSDTIDTVLERTFTCPGCNHVITVMFLEPTNHARFESFTRVIDTHLIDCHDGIGIFPFYTITTKYY